MFILALQRFVARRGNVRTMRSDNITNFVEAENEFVKALKEMDQKKVKHYQLGIGCDWIKWKRNQPEALHMGGSWERQIRSVRSILKDIFNHHGQSLNEESLHTILTDVESIVNSRTLAVETLSDPNSIAPISPMTLLTMKSKIVLRPPGNFEDALLIPKNSGKEHNMC